MLRINKIAYSIIISIVCLVFVFLDDYSLAYSSIDGQPAPSQINPLEYLQKNLLPSNLQNSQGIGTTVPALPGTLPVNFRGLLSNTGNLGDFKLLNTEGLSSGSIVDMLKAVATLAINLFLIVIQVVVGILKALLPFLSK